MPSLPVLSGFRGGVTEEANKEILSSNDRLPGLSSSSTLRLQGHEATLNDSLRLPTGMQQGPLSGQDIRESECAVRFRNAVREGRT